MGSKDFRSDTVTKPTEKMREAMFKAVVGDDVCGDDPTVKELEDIAAKKTGKEAALFVPSGTFGNQLCIRTHTSLGDEIILSEQSHIIKHEAGALSVVSSVQSLTIDTQGSYLTDKHIEKRIRPDDLHYPKTGLICLENALANGTVMPISEMRRVYELSRKYNVPIHLDGARLFNAAVSLNVEAQDIAKYCDSVMFCLSKGLSAPIGSVVCGNKEFIEKAHKNRKIMGGAMRQVGIIASAGIIAINDMTKRLHEDHDNARHLAKLLSQIDEIDIDINSVQINMVFFSLNSKAKINNDILVQSLIEKGYKLYPPEDNIIRLVTNNDNDRKDIDDIVNDIKSILNR